MSPMAPVYAALARVWASACLTAALVCGCTSNPYYIGAVCQGCAGAGAGTGGGASSALSFALDLNQSGASLLPSQLANASGAPTATLSFHGESATASTWPAEQGPLLASAAGTPLLSRAAPFTDGTRALAFSGTAPVYTALSADTGAVAADDFALEVVLRVTPGSTLLDRRGGSVGYALDVAANGALVLSLRDAQRTLEIDSEPLLARTWYHCLFWVSRSAGGRADCNGRAGSTSDLSAVGSLQGSSALSVGGGTPNSDLPNELAYFALFRTAPGGLGAQSTWTNISRQRFATLTGISPRVAHGSALPRTGLRDSPAYLDLQDDGSDVRRLFPVGPDWPRVSCRSDTNGARACGYLGEAVRTRWLDPEPGNWTPSALTVVPNQAAFADGELRMSGLVPASSSTPQTLEWMGSYSGARQVLSFFARAEAGNYVGVSVGTWGVVVFDLATGAVVVNQLGVDARIEPWGDGLFRCSYGFTPEMGALVYRLQLLANPRLQPALANGTAFIDLAELQLDVGQAYAGSPLAAASQPAEHLSFIADDGNLPSSPAVSQRMSVLLPAGPRLTDQPMLNLNLAEKFANQVQLYITGNTSELQFWGLRDGATHWAFGHPVSLVDGRQHQIQADWTTDSAILAVDGAALPKAALIANDPPFSLDHIDIGYSTLSLDDPMGASPSGGSLEGLLGGIEIGPLTTP